MTTEYTATAFEEAFSKEELARLAFDFLFELQHQPSFNSPLPTLKGVAVFDKDEDEGEGCFVVEGYYDRITQSVVLSRIWDSDEEMPDIALDLISDLKKQIKH